LLRGIKDALHHRNEKSIEIGVCRMCEGLAEGRIKVGARDTSYPTVLQFHGASTVTFIDDGSTRCQETHRSRYVQVPLCDRAGWLRSGRYRCHEM